MGRASHHDYRRKGLYHITLRKHPDMQPFGYLAGSLPDVYIRRTGAGQAVATNIAAIPTFSSHLRILQYMIMPDHIHLLIHVTDTLDRHLGNYMGMFKVKTGQTYREMYPWVKELSGRPVFEEDFYDCILYPSRPLDTVIKYIKDNPRRLAERRANPEYFRRVNNLIINGRQCQAYGNMQLLRNPFKEQVVVHRADTPGQRESNLERWLYTASNGGVLVSPFISAAEKAVRTEAEAAGGRMILLTSERFGELYKPAAHNFDLCLSGRLLIISAAPSLPAVPEPTISRSTCLALNALAEAIAGGHESDS